MYTFELTYDYLSSSDLNMKVRTNEETNWEELLDKIHLVLLLNPLTVSILLSMLMTVDLFRLFVLKKPVFEENYE